MRHYSVSFIVDVDLKVSEEAMERALSDPDFPYFDMDEESTVEMLARCIGIYELPLTALDGWADMDNENAVASRVDIHMDDWARYDSIE